MSTTAAATPRSPLRASLPAANLDVQVVSLSRNFGKEAALLAGLDHARLGAVLFMDGDGQHPPTLVEKLVELLARSRLRRRLHRQGAPRKRAVAAPASASGCSMR